MRGGLIGSLSSNSLIAILIASIEATFFVKQIEKHLEFFLENYVFRACAYAVYGIVHYFSGLSHTDLL